MLSVTNKVIRTGDVGSAAVGVRTRVLVGILIGYKIYAYVHIT